MARHRICHSTMFLIYSKKRTDFGKEYFSFYPNQYHENKWKHCIIYNSPEWRTDKYHLSFQALPFLHAKETFRFSSDRCNFSEYSEPDLSKNTFSVHFFHLCRKHIPPLIILFDSFKVNKRFLKRRIIWIR
jgi:hypothetical protein